MKSLYLHAAVATVLSVCSLSAIADPSIECLSGSGAAGYNSGVTAERNVVGYLWRNVHQQDCYKLEEFIEAVQVPYVGTASSSAFLRCRDQGLIDGIAQEVTSVSNQCVSESLDNGEEVGKFHGRLYCGVVGQQYRTCAVIRLASAVAEQSCKVSMQAYVNQNCAGKASSMGDLATVIDLACKF